MALFLFNWLSYLPVDDSYLFGDRGVQKTDSDTGTPQAKTQAKIIYKQNLASSPGMMHLTLPQNQPGLAVGKKYRWQIVMHCTRYLAINKKCRATGLFIYRQIYRQTK